MISLVPVRSGVGGAGGAQTDTQTLQKIHTRTNAESSVANGPSDGRRMRGCRTQNPHNHTRAHTQHSASSALTVTSRVGFGVSICARARSLRFARLGARVCVCRADTLTVGRHSGPVGSPPTEMRSAAYRSGCVHATDSDSGRHASQRRRAPTTTTTTTTRHATTARDYDDVLRRPRHDRHQPHRI